MTLKLSKDITDEEFESFCNLNDGTITEYHKRLNRWVIVSDSIGNLLFISMKFASSLITVLIKKEEQ